MRRSFWWQLLAISLLVTIVCGSISLLLFRRASAPVSQESRRNMMLFLANIVESAPYAEGLQRYQRFRVDSPSIGRSVWILADNGSVLASNTGEAPPAEWRQIPKPQKRHEISTKMPRFSYFAELVLVRLDKPEPVFLLVRPEKDTPNKALVGVEITIFLLGLFGTSLTGLAMVFVYLRRTSAEARQVMAQMHGGQLNARFTIRKFDEISNLKLDFNAMADEIEQLVLRVQATGQARRNLLQELGHDLRTPLTSLRTSIESLTLYQAQMTPAQQQEFLAVAQSELDYFMRLLEDLFFIADIAEPGYQASLAPLDLRAVCQAELATRAIAQAPLQWHLDDDGAGEAAIDGDAHLILRLLRNCLDNAGKYARSKVWLTLRTGAGPLELQIADDGPGITPEAQKAFGERRRHRLRSDSFHAGASLGLGSVIIKTIVELHGGSMQLASGTGVNGSGTTLTLQFPRRAK